jgi:hypothetical protein
VELSGRPEAFQIRRGAGWTKAKPMKTSMAKYVVMT